MYTLRFPSRNCRNLVTFVPQHQPTSDSDICRLRDFFIAYKGDIVVLTGAGVSTESGIPDYRSKDVGLYARSNHKPITYQEFVKNSESRRRYWARSFVGWARFSSVTPNVTHHTINRLEKNGFISCVVTQNVDNLHQKAATNHVVELHGTLYRVSCTSCNYTVDRHEFQAVMHKLNPKMQITTKILRPDGDVSLNKDEIDSFIVPSCPSCDGFMKPNVIFFGENVPPKRTEVIKQILNKCRALLVLGSSISVYSAYRIVLQVTDAIKPVCIVNIGDTRADHLATTKINTNCCDILPLVYHKLSLISC